MKRRLAVVWQCANNQLGGSDFRRIGHIAQQVIKITKEHKPDASAQIVPILFSRTELGSAILIAQIAQLQDLMDVKGQKVEHKEVVG